MAPSAAAAIAGSAVAPCRRDRGVDPYPLAPMPRRHLVILPVAALVALASCSSDDGRELPPAGPDQTRSVLTTSTAPPVSTDPALAEEVIGDLTTASTAELALVLPWEDDGVIDIRYTCTGDNVSPAITWSNVPDGTVEIAIVMSDPDANGFVHWVVAGLDPLAGGIPEGAVPPTAVQAVNDFGDLGYGGPCPPTSHTYVVDIYAIGQQLELPTGVPASDLVRAIESSLIATRSVAGHFP